MEEGMVRGDMKKEKKDEDMEKEDMEKEDKGGH